MAVATQEVFAHTDALCEVWKLAAATPARTLVVQGGRVGITLTDTKGVVKASQSLYPGGPTVSGVTQPGVGNEDVTWAQGAGDYAVGVATDGTWEFEGVGAADTAQGVPVYVTGAGAVTLTEGSNTKIGVVNYPASYNRGQTPKALPVKIGV